MISFVDAYRDEHGDEYGVEPICRVLAIAPSTYHAHARSRENPQTAPVRVGLGAPAFARGKRKSL